jgi:hypothetical protein
VVPGSQLVIRHPGHRRAGLGQCAEDLVEQRAQFLGRDVAGRAHDHAVACQNGAVRVEQVVAGQRADALPRAFQRAAIGVIAPGHGVEGLARDLVGVARVAIDDRQDLPAHPFHRVLVEARGDKGRAQEIGGLLAVFRQHAGRDRQRVAIDVELEACGQPLHRLGEGAGVHVLGAFFQQPGHQVNRATLAGSVERRAAIEPDLDGDEGDGVVLHQPCLDPAGGGHLLDVDGAGGAWQEQDCRGQKSKNAGDHCNSSSDSAAGSVGAAAVCVAALLAAAASGCDEGCIR